MVTQAAPTAGALECGRALVCRLVSQSRASVLFTGSAAGLLWAPRWDVGEVWMWSLILSIFMACVSFTKWETLGQTTEAALSKEPSGDRQQGEGVAEVLAPESADCFSRSTTLLLRDWAQPEALGKPQPGGGNGGLLSNHGLIPEKATDYLSLHARQ